MAAQRKDNYYIIEGDIVKLELTRKNGNESQWALIDLDELERVTNFPYCWCASYDAHVKSFYVHSFHYANKKKELLHMFIGNRNNIPNVYVDHINHNTLDNRKENLRIIKGESNTRNRKSKNSNNKSGYRNVFWSNRDDVWLVRLQINGRQKQLGSFNDVHKAGLFAEEMREKHYGEYKGLS